MKELSWRLAACVCLVVFMSSVDAAPRAEQPEQSPVFSKCWEFRAVPDLKVSPVSDQTNVYFLDNENKLVSVQLNSGQKVWSAELGGGLVSNLLIAGDSIFIVTGVPASSAHASKAVLWSLSRQTGITEWRTEISSSPSVALGQSLRNILAVGSDGVVVALDLRGAVIWRTELGSQLSSEPYFDDSGVVIGTAKNEVLTLGGGDGGRQLLWKAPHAPTAVYLNSRTRLLVGDERGNLFSLPPGGKPAWRFRNGARISRVLSNDTEYIAISDDNFVYNVSRSGDVKWKRRLPGRVAGSPLVLNRALVVSIAGAGALYVLDLKNGKVSNKIETGDETSLSFAGVPDLQGFVMAGVGGLTHFSRAKCPVK